MGDYTAVIQLVTFISALAAAAIWLRSAVVKQNHEELESLAETRGEIIEDLRSKVAALEYENAELKARVAVLEDLIRRSN